MSTEPPPSNSGQDSTSTAQSVSAQQPTPTLNNLLSTSSGSGSAKPVVGQITTTTAMADNSAPAATAQPAQSAPTPTSQPSGGAQAQNGPTPTPSVDPYAQTADAVAAAAAAASNPKTVQAPPPQSMTQPGQGMPQGQPHPAHMPQLPQQMPQGPGPSRPGEWPPQDGSQHQPHQQMPQHPMMPPPHHGYPPGYPPHSQYMMQRGPPPPGNYGAYPGPAPHGYPYGYPAAHHMPPHMMQHRMGPPPPPQQGDIVRMPPGPTPTEWAAQQQKMKEGPTPTPPSSMANQSPATSSMGGEDGQQGQGQQMMDDRNRLESPPWGNRQRMPGGQMPPPMSHHPGAPPHPGYHMGPPPMGQHPHMMQPMPHHMQQPHPSMHHPQHMQMQPGAPPGQAQGQPQRRESIVDKLVGPPTQHNPPHVMPERRAFFDKLVAWCEHQGDPITMIPQVSKQNIDLHRLYIAVRNKGGFEQVTKDKAWKTICTDANQELSESSAAGYQLRRHYQKYLLSLECAETGRSQDDAMAFAEKLKRQRKKEPSGPGTPGTSGQGASTPGSASAPGVPPAAAPSGAPTPQQAPYPPGSQAGQMPPHDPAVAAYYQQYGQMPPPQHHPGYPPHPSQMPPGYSPGQFPMPPRPGMTPMRAPMPQPHMDGQPPAEWGSPQASHHQPPTSSSQHLTVPGQGVAAGPGTPASGQPATPAALAGAEASGSAAPSRAPSTGPPHSVTPDSASRMSALSESGHAEAAHHQPGTSASAATSIATSQPSTSMAPPMTAAASVQNSVNSQQPPHQAAPAPGPYYGQPPPMYAGAQQGRPGAYPPQYGPPPGGYPPPTHPSQVPPHYQPHPQYMWNRGYPAPPNAAPGGTPGGPPPQGQMPPQHRYYPPPQGATPQGTPAHMPQRGQAMGPPTAHQTSQGQPPTNQLMPPAQTPVANQMGAPSPSSTPASTKVRYPASAAGQPPQGYPSPLPGGRQTQPYAPGQMTGVQGQAPQPSHQVPHPPPQATPHVSASAYMAQHHHTFPPGSVEATTISQKRRRKILSRELIQATPRRIIMALRSGLESEAVWAINALNVLLHDDTQPNPPIMQLPGLLNVILEHLWATLSVLWPDKFKTVSPNSIPEVTQEEVANLGTLTNGNSQAEVRQLVGTKHGEKRNQNYTKTTRTGRKVQFKEAPMPEELKKRYILDGKSQAEFDVDPNLSLDYVCSRLRFGLGGGLAERVASFLRAQIEHANSCTHPAFSAYSTKLRQDGSAEHDENGNTKDKVKQEMLEDGNEQKVEELPAILLCRAGREEELVDEPNMVELVQPRNTALSTTSAIWKRMAHRALALSNIIRGMSFIPKAEEALCRHEGVLYLLGQLLMLDAEEKRVNRATPAARVPLDAPLPEADTYEEMREKALALLDADDPLQLLLSETAAQLRDDTFVVLSHLSVVLDVSELADHIAYPIQSGLLHWSISSVPEATDPMPQATLAPRNYALETLCKMSVLERNVDMLVATGPWPRIEKLTRILANLLHMQEETQNREFAIVILNALCNASEEAGYVAVHDTPAVAHLITFIESADQNMHQVMQAHGMNALRETPEMMGTSVGMLRRASAMLRVLVTVPRAHKVFARHQQRLLQFTMSQLMDSRVAGMIADTLYEMQARQRKEDSPVNTAKEEEIVKENGTFTPRKEKELNGNTKDVGDTQSEASYSQPSALPADEISNRAESGASSSASSQPDEKKANKEGMINGNGSTKRAVKLEDEESAAIDGKGGKMSGKRQRMSDEDTETQPAAKRQCNGFDDSTKTANLKKNGKIEKSPASGGNGSGKAAASHTSDNGSTMTVVA